MDLRSLIQSAEDRWRQGRYHAALDAYAHILRLRLGDHLAEQLGADDLTVIERLADLATLAGDSAAADRLLEGMAALCWQHGNRYAADYTTLKRAHLALGAGRARDAYLQLQSLGPSVGDVSAISFTPAGMAAWEGACAWAALDADSRDILFTRVYLALGWSLAAVGQYRQALGALRRGRDRARRASHDLARRAEVPLWLALIAALIEQGDLATAEGELQAAERGCQASDHPAYRLRWLELDGQLALLYGEYARGRRRAAEARAYCAAQQLPQAALGCYVNEATALITLNQTLEATRALDHAEQIAHEIADQQAASRITLLRQLALARGVSLAERVAIAPSVTELWSRDRHAPPAQSPPEQLPDLPQPAQYLTFFSDQALAFQWRLAYCGLDAAQAYLQRMVACFQETDSTLIQLRLLVLHGMFAYYRGQAAEAEKLLTTATPHLEAQGLRPELYQAQRFRSWCWAALDRPHADQLELSRANSRLLDSLAATLDGPDQALFLLNKWTEEEEAFAIWSNEIAARGVRGAAGPAILRPLRQIGLRREIRRLQAAIDRHKGLAAARLSDSQPGQAQPGRSARWQPRDRATISFLVLPDRVLITCAYRQQLTFGISSTTRLQLRNLLRRLHEAIQRSAWSESGRHLRLVRRAEPEDGQITAIAAEVAEQLQLTALLAQLPPTITALTIVPDDCLHGFPFAALSVGGQPLIQRYRLNLSPQHVDDRRRATRRRGILLLAGVSQAVRDLPPLAAVSKELDTLESWAQGRQIATERYQDDLSQREPIIAALQHTHMAHIACHGAFAPDNPGESGLLLFPNDAQSDLLSLRDLSKLDLGGLEHISLATCWSADTFILPGRQIIGLPETLWRSRAGSILGSLWPVHDELSSAFMRQFYAYLDQHPRDEALRRTQLDCLSNQLPGCAEAKRRTEHPSFWAGFTLYGRPGRIF